MKKVRKISDGQHYTALDLGPLSELSGYSTIHPKSGRSIEGKIFLKELTGATGTEISFQILPPGTELSYFHLHNKNEETYIVLKGCGDFQVDDDRFAVAEGSVVRIAPQGIRTLRSTGDGPMVYMVVQSKAGSLEEYSSGDGTRVDHEYKWK